MNLTKIADSGQCFRWVQLAPGRYGIPSGHGYCIVQQEGADTRIVDYTGEPLDYWRNYLCYGEFYPAITHGSGYLQTAAQFSSGMVILRQNLWEVIASYIISQNNNIPRIKGIIERLCETYGTRHEWTSKGGDHVIWHEFPTPQQLSQYSLPVGLGYREGYLINASYSFFTHPEQFTELQTISYKAAREMLLTMQGVGPKVADCICLFGLHHLEAFPCDVWINRIMAARFPDGLPDCYKPYAGYIQQLLYYYAREGDQ